MKKNNFIYFIILSNVLFADSIFVSFDQILLSVRAFHPIVKKIALTQPAIKSRVMLAKGMFDPILSSVYDDKSFNEKKYYSKWYHELKIPTFTGIDLKGNIETNSGHYLNFEDYTNDGTILSIGAQIPVGRNLLFNERRLMLRQAKILEQASEAFQNRFLNEFVLNLGLDYAEWLFSFRKLLLYSNAYNLAKERYEFMLQRIQFGDEAPIDSTEMSIQIQFISARLAESKADYALKKAKVNTYLWSEDGKPLEMADNMYPAIGFNTIKKTFDSIFIKEPISIVLNNPEIVAAQAELKTLKLATLYSRFQFLPDLYIGYAALNSLTSPLPAWNLSDNRKWNGYLYVPLFLRKERAKVQLNKIKETEKDLDIQQKMRELELKLKAMKEQYLQLVNQNKIFLLALHNSILLRDAEKIKFNNGESSVFLINVRENNLLDMNVRYFENEMRIQKFYFDFTNIAGVLYKIL